MLRSQGTFTWVLRCEEARKQASNQRMLYKHVSHPESIEFRFPSRSTLSLVVSAWWLTCIKTGQQILEGFFVSWIILFSFCWWPLRCGRCSASPCSIDSSSCSSSRQRIRGVAGVVSRRKEILHEQLVGKGRGG